MNDTPENDLPEGINFPKFKLEDFKGDVEDAEIVETKEAQTGGKLSKEDLIAKGLLPPKKKAQTMESSITEIPVEKMIKTEVKSSYPNEQDDPLFKKASTRMGMALELIKVMVAGQKQDVGDMVQYAFAIADDIQAEADRGYQQDLMDRTAERLKGLMPTV
jgi:hypothetical protein